MDVPQEYLDALSDAEKRLTAKQQHYDKAKEQAKNARAQLEEAQADLRQAASNIVHLEERDKFPADSPMAQAAQGS